jgi:uncharacterized protein YceK
MKKIYHSSKVTRNIIVALTFAVFLIASGCYTIAYIIQSTGITPNSTFDVKLCIKSNEKWGYDDYVIGYGILGILLPEGWTVKDSVPFFKAAHINSYVEEGFLCYNNDVVSFLRYSLSSPPEGYYWWGAKSINEIDLAYFDSGYVHVTFKTDEKIGEFNLKYFLGDDNVWNKSSNNDLFTIITQSEFIPVKVGITQNSEPIQADMEWKLYPNPATNQVTFVWSQKYELLNLKLYQINGNCVLHREIFSNETVSLENLPKGVYLYKLSDRKLILNTGKLVIE